MNYTIQYTRDYALYSQIHDALYSYNLSKTGAVRQDIKSPAYPDAEALVVVGEDNNLYGGIVWHWLESHSIARVEFFFTAEVLRGSGYGMALFAEFEKRVTAAGAKAVSLSTNTFQAPRLYEKMGFKVVSKKNEPQPDIPDNIHYEFIKELQRSKENQQSCIR